MYSKEQSEALKEAFLRTEYPSYRDRLHLAARLHLDEHRVQVRAPAPLGRPPPAGAAGGDCEARGARTAQVPQQARGLPAVDPGLDPGPPQPWAISSSQPHPACLSPPLPRGVPVPSPQGP